MRKSKCNEPAVVCDYRRLGRIELFGCPIRFAARRRITANVFRNAPPSLSPDLRPYYFSFVFQFEDLNSDCVLVLERAPGSWKWNSVMPLNSSGVDRRASGPVIESLFFLFFLSRRSLG
jgi:hypothetical protein